jgi:hypothetical protein
VTTWIVWQQLTLFRTMIFFNWQIGSYENSQNLLSTTTGKIWRSTKLLSSWYSSPICVMLQPGYERWSKLVGIADPPANLPLVTRNHHHHHHLHCIVCEVHPFGHIVHNPLSGYRCFERKNPWIGRQSPSDWLVFFLPIVCLWPIELPLVKCGCDSWSGAAGSTKIASFFHISWRWTQDGQRFF